MQYNFYYNNRCAVNGISCAIKKFLNTNLAPIIVCVGSDLISGDSLGPLTGSMLKTKLAPKKITVFGSLENTVTAKEVKYLNNLLRKTFLNRLIICVDAAVGEFSDVGVIKVSDSPLYPGSGINKKLGKIGDISVQGVVAEKNLASRAALSSVRMNMVYKMSAIISDSIAGYLS